MDSIDEIVDMVKENHIELFKDVFCSRYQCDNITYIEKEIIVLDPDGYMLRFSETVECVEE